MVRHGQKPAQCGDTEMTRAITFLIILGTGLACGHLLAAETSGAFNPYAAMLAELRD